MAEQAKQAGVSFDRPVNVWTLTLNRYQRDNLFSLLTAVLYGEIEGWNTGDWLGEIYQMLGKITGEYDTRISYSTRRPRHTDSKGEAETMTETYTPPVPATPQDAFDLVAAHLRKQKIRAMGRSRRSVNALDLSCLYLDEKLHCRCAIGLFMTDEEARYIDSVGANYTSISHRDGRMRESPLVDAFLSRVGAALSYEGGPMPNGPLGSALQLVHDIRDNWLDEGGLSPIGEAALARVARHYGLEYTAP